MNGVCLVYSLCQGFNMRGPSGVIIGPITISSRGDTSSPAELVGSFANLQVNPTTAIKTPTNTTMASPFLADNANGARGEIETDIDRLLSSTISYTAFPYSRRDALRTLRKARPADC